MVLMVLVCVGSGGRSGNSGCCLGGENLIIVLIVLHAKCCVGHLRRMRVFFFIVWTLGGITLDIV